MPVAKRWSRFTRDNVNRIPKGICGIYEIANKNKVIIYRGSSDSQLGVKGRLTNHLLNRRFPSAMYFRYASTGFFETGLDMEARHTRRQILKTGKKPKRMKRVPHLRDIFGFPLD